MQILFVTNDKEMRAPKLKFEILIQIGSLMVSGDRNRNRAEARKLM